MTHPRPTAVVRPYRGLEPAGPIRARVWSAVHRGAPLVHARDVPARIDLAAVLAGFTEPWQPRTVAALNDSDVRVAHALGEFPRHTHPETDELFLVTRGRLTIRLDDGDVELGPGQVYVVPKGVPHQPVSEQGADIVLVEPSATVNTGDSPGELTAERRVV